jgi:multidrug transporter EmrE-like cation transporter
LLYGVSVSTWIVGLSRVPRSSQAYPMLSLGYVLTATLAWQWMNEPISAMRWAGIGVIIVGVWLVSRS